MIEIKAPTIPINAEINLPLSKSLENRQLILDFLRGKTISASSENEAEDIQLMKSALNQIQSGQNSIQVKHAGTAMRFLTALLVITPGEWTISGSERMHQRPIMPLVDALIQLGANIQYLGQIGFPPLRISGEKISGGSCQVQADISSQFISALVLIAPFLKNGLKLYPKGNFVSLPYLTMSIELLKQQGVSIQSSPQAIEVKAGINSYRVPSEGDWTAASYLFSICALSKNAQIRTKGLHVNSLQGDSILMKMFDPLGAESFFEAGDLVIRNKAITQSNFEWNFVDCPDLAQTMAATCFGLGIEATLTGLSTLKIKESDRIAALATELTRLGASIESGSDFIHIHQRRLAVHSNSTIQTYNDHRMAMSFAPLALVCNQISIANENVVNKSWPLYWQHLKSLGFSVNLQPT